MSSSGFQRRDAHAGRQQAQLDEQSHEDAARRRSSVRETSIPGGGAGRPTRRRNRIDELREIRQEGRLNEAERGKGEGRALESSPHRQNISRTNGVDANHIDAEIQQPTRDEAESNEHLAHAETEA